MNRTEMLDYIASRYPAIPASVAKRHWRKSDAFLRMLNRKYAAHADGGTLTQVVQDVASKITIKDKNYNDLGSLLHRDGWAHRTQGYDYPLATPRA